jgi:hypothetical protein
MMVEALFAVEAAGTNLLLLLWCGEKADVGLS